jgi:hypothetical protein
MSDCFSVCSHLGLARSLSPLTLVFCKWFDRSLERLTAPERRDVSAAVMDLRMNPDLPGLRPHKLSNGLRSISANMDLRIILHVEGATAICLHAGRHDAAYRWAERHRVGRHVVTGALQLVELPLVEAPAPPVRREARADSPVPFFAGEDPSWLLSLGVPPDWIAPVQAIDSDDTLLDLADHIPEDVVERLLDLRYGRRPEPPPLPADRDALSAASNARQFRVVADDAALQDALGRPWPEWAIWLHPDQRAAVEASHRGPARVTGPGRDRHDGGGAAQGGAAGPRAAGRACQGLDPRRCGASDGRMGSGAHLAGHHRGAGPCRALVRALAEAAAPGETRSGPWRSSGWRSWGSSPGSGAARAILSGMVRRIGMARLERASHAVCAGIEGRLHRVSREETALEQLARLTGLKDHMTARTTALVAEPGAALDAPVEGLARAIAAPVGEASTRLVEAAERLDGVALGSDPGRAVLPQRSGSSTP